MVPVPPGTVGKRRVGLDAAIPVELSSGCDTAVLRKQRILPFCEPLLLHPGRTAHKPSRLCFFVALPARAFFQTPACVFCCDSHPFDGCLCLQANLLAFQVHHRCSPALAALLGVMLSRYANPALLLAFSYCLLFWTAATHIQARDSFREGQLPPGHSDRQTAQYIGQHARKGDVVVFTSLSRTAVDYYLNRQVCRDCFRKVSFPAQIDMHPTWRDVAGMLKDRESLEHEADKAVAEWTELAVRDGASIWFLYESRSARHRYPETETG